MLSSKRLKGFLTSAFIAAAAFIPVTAIPEEEHPGFTQDQINKLNLIERDIERNYVDPAKGRDKQKLMEGAIDGMLKSLDPHSRYLNQDAVKAENQEMTGTFVGIGIHVGTKVQTAIKVEKVIPDSPAEHAGLKKGDLITRVVDKNQNVDVTISDARTFELAVKSLSGKAHTPVQLTIMRDGVQKDITVIRDAITESAIVARRIGDIGYIQIKDYMNKNVADDFEKAVRQFQTDGKKLSGIIVDERYNPGGFLNKVVRIVDDLVDAEGVAVTSKGRGGSQDSTAYPVNSGDITGGIPIVVLVNDGTASASEIFAGAMQDYKRAVILGIQTYGKGSVQVSEGYRDGTEVWLTTALYYTPSGRSIQGHGITPDVLYIPTPFEVKAREGYPLRSEAKEKNYITKTDAPAQDETKTTETCGMKDDAAINDLDKGLLYEGVEKPTPDGAMVCAVEYLHKTSKFTTVKPYIAPPPDAPSP